LATPAPVVATIAEYADFISASDLAMAIAIDPVIAQCAVELGYRASLTVNELIYRAFG
jgi:hypothetical protein